MRISMTILLKILPPTFFCYVVERAMRRLIKTCQFHQLRPFVCIAHIHLSRDLFLFSVIILQYYFQLHMRNINQNQSKIVEGTLRSHELFDYLTERKAGLDIWIAEDASGIVPKIQYDSVRDELVGMTLEIDINTGCPRKFVSTAKDADQIKEFMKHDKSKLVYIVIAIPLKEEIPPYIIQLFGTNNKFKTIDVVRMVRDFQRYFQSQSTHIYTLLNYNSIFN